MQENEDLLALTHYAENPASYMRAVVPPVFMTSLYVYDDMDAYAAADTFAHGQYTYGRSSNPTVRILEDKVARLEHGVRGAAFASGMAAATAAIFATCTAGSHIICLRDSYQPVKRFLNTIGVRLSMSVTYWDGRDLQELESAIRPETSLILLESPATFVFTVVDLPGVAAIAKKHGVKTYIDNTYCTPLFQKPLDMGIDIVMHTLSKYIGGHSDLIGGILTSKDDALMRRIIGQCREWLGGILGPAEAWLALRGLRTLDVRVRRHQATATAVAAYLERQPQVKWVRYTGLPSHPQHALIARQQTGHTGLMSFVLDASVEKTVQFINRLKLFGKGCSWGGFESLAIMPLYKATDEELAFLNLRDARGLVRLHCGLEGEQNLLADLEQALRTL